MTKNPVKELVLWEMMAGGQLKDSGGGVYAWLIFGGSRGLQDHGNREKMLPGKILLRKCYKSSVAFRKFQYHSLISVSKLIHMMFPESADPTVISKSHRVSEYQWCRETVRV